MHDEELGRRALRRVVDRFVRTNVGKVVPRQKSQLLSNGSCRKDKTLLAPRKSAFGQVRFGGQIEVAENPGGLNRSMQHWLGVYSPAFQSPKFVAGVD